MKKRAMGLYIAVLLLLTGCSHGAVSPKQGDGEENGIKVYQSNIFGCAAPEGFYYLDSGSFLYYFDYRLQKGSIVCNKPNCRHEQSSEGTPAEEKCSAYIGIRSNGFVSGGKLYIMDQGFNENGISAKTFGQTRIVESDLDRTRQREVGVWDCDGVHSFAVKEGTLYAVMTQQEKEESEDHSVQTGSRNKSLLTEISLADGSEKTLLEKEGFNEELIILAAKEDMLYLKDCFFAQAFDGTNFQEARYQQRYYEYSLDSGELTEILTGMDTYEIRKACIKNGDFFAYTTPVDNTQDTEGALRRIVPETGEEEVIVETKGYAVMLDDYAVYEKEGEEGVFFYDFARQKETTAPDLNLDNIGLYCSAGEYVYGSYQGSMGLYLLKDLMEGRNQIIPVQN